MAVSRVVNVEQKKKLQKKDVQSNVYEAPPLGKL